MTDQTMAEYLTSEREAILAEYEAEILAAYDKARARLHALEDAGDEHHDGPSAR